MTEKVQILLNNLNAKEHRKIRVQKPEPEFEKGFQPWISARNFKIFADTDVPVLLSGDRFGFNRGTTVKGLCGNGNVTPNYGSIISMGFEKVSGKIRESMKNTNQPEKISMGEAMLDTIQTVYNISDRYKALAKEQGNKELYDALCNIPRKGAENLYEALVFMKISLYIMRLSFHAHITLGRFDQYMYPFYLKSRETGMKDEEIFELIEEFFIAINRDTDLYFGIQQGDNGQSMVLGGFDKDGKSMYNELSQMCMQASLELKLIDPKINLRVRKNTPPELFEFATTLTKAGLGFPQYCNDDVVVPGLVKLGYSYEDALDYTVAACWEYIIPGKGADVPNLATMDFPGVTAGVVKEKLLQCKSFEELMGYVKAAITRESEKIAMSQMSKKYPDSPLLSIYMDGCTENLTDLFRNGTKYNNFGCHGAGIANATDALAAIKKNVFQKKTISPSALISALEKNFEGFEDIRNMLRNSPKMGNNDDYADSIAGEITATFAESMNGRDNGHGGIWRAGTGSAMDYIRCGEGCPATADGRKAGEPYSSSYSPSLDVKTTGLLSTIQSFTKFDFTNIINGGPLTIEIHDTVLKNDIGVKKTAMLVNQYILLGGHQLQINSINRERLLDAQQHPENYANLIVRVWGWSGYFNELDVKYQNHIIRRLEYSNI